MRRFGPLGLLLPALLLAGLATFAPLSPAVSRCAAAGQSHAGLVVEHSDGSVVTRCVAFDALSISGEQLLTVSGVAWSGQTFGAFGVAVCALDAEPVRYAECPGADRYWAVFVARAGGSWQLANVGISSLQLGDGDAAGFRYVPSSGVPAAPVSATGACPTPTPVPPPPTAAASAPTVRPAPAAARGAATADATAGSTPAISAVAVVAGVTAAPTSSGVPAAPAGGVAAASPTTAPLAPIPAPAGSGGPDVGLLAAAVAGGGLAGLAVLRLRSGRRRST